MKFTEEQLALLDGRRFHNGYRFRFERSRPDPRTRFAYLRALAAGKKVLHVGCADHNPETIARKRRDGRWLHDTLLSSAAICYGVDIDRRSVDYITGELGIDHVHCANLLEEAPAWLGDHHWDLVVCGELVEHIDNPVAFLAALHARLRGRATQCAITVPNAFYYRHAALARRGIEHINTDHRFWFSPFTIAKVARRAGFQLDEVHLLEDFRLSPMPPLPFVRLHLFPLQRSRVVLLARFDG
jgi:hypothetical protein